MTRPIPTNESDAVVLRKFLDDAHPLLHQLLEKWNHEDVPFEELVVIAQYEPNGDIGVSGIMRDDYLRQFDAETRRDPVHQRTYDAVVAKDPRSVPVIAIVERDGYHATCVVRLDIDVHVVRGESSDTRARDRCSTCGEKFVVAVHQSAAGYYIGTWCCVGPNSRDSGYYPSKAEAQRALDAGTYGR